MDIVPNPRRATRQHASSALHGQNRRTQGRLPGSNPQSHSAHASKIPVSNQCTSCRLYRRSLALNGLREGMFAKNRERSQGAPERVTTKSNRCSPSESWWVLVHHIETPLEGQPHSRHCPFVEQPSQKSNPHA